MGQLFKHGVAQWYIANAKRNEGEGRKCIDWGKETKLLLAMTVGSQRR